MNMHSEIKIQYNPYSIVYLLYEQMCNTHDNTCVNRTFIWIMPYDLPPNVLITHVKVLFTHVLSCITHLSHFSHYLPSTKCVNDTYESSIYTCVIMCVTHLSHCAHYVPL